MRITKKYAGPYCIGKQIFQPLEDRSNLGSNSALHSANVGPEEIRKDELELEILEKIFQTRLGIPQRVGGGKINCLQVSSGPSSLRLDSCNDKNVASSYLSNHSYDNDDCVSLTDNDKNVLSANQNVVSLKEKSLPSNESSQTIHSHISSGNNSSNGNNTNSSGVMMRRAVSAPELKNMATTSSPWKEVSSDATLSVVTDIQLLKGVTEKRKYLSHPRTLQYGLASAGTGTCIRKSRSMFDLMDFEDYYGDDFAAG